MPQVEVRTNRTMTYIGSLLSSPDSLPFPLPLPLHPPPHSSTCTKKRRNMISKFAMAIDPEINRSTP